MIKLETNFTSGDNGYSQAPGPLNYKQLARTASVAIYQRFYADGRSKDWEVFRIKIKPKGSKIFELITEDDQETYPGGSQFGKNAWSYSNQSRAQSKYDELCKEADTDDGRGAISVKVEGVSPVGEFTTKEFAASNGIEYPEAFLLIKAGLENKSIIFLREERRNAKGKASKVYSKV